MCSSTGCVTCKAKRLKCGEEKPACHQCNKRNVECGGYKKDFKWRPFEETNARLNIDRQKRGILARKYICSSSGIEDMTPLLTISPASPPAQASATCSKPASPVNETAPSLPAPHIQGKGRRKDSKRPSAVEDEQTTTALPRRPAKAKRKSRPSSRDTPGSPTESQPEPESAPPPAGECQTQDRSSSVPINFEASGEIERPDQASQPSLAPTFGLSPTLTELLLPFTNETIINGDFINFELPAGLQYPLPSPELDPALLDDEVTESDVEEIVRPDVPTNVLPYFVPSRRHTPSSLTLSPGDDYGPWRGPVNYPYATSYYAQDSPEMLTFRFDKMTCGILSIMDGPTENPWRSLVWPLALQSPALYHAVTAMTAFHSSKDIPALRVVGHEHKQASIRYIQEGIRDHSMTDQTAIATALALGFSESWDQHTASGNTHIKGAQALVKRALADHQHKPLQGVELARLKFLCNAWVYMDVIARLTAVDSDESNDFDNTFLFASDSPNMVMGDSGPPGFGIDFGTGIDARLDPLMGCANTLFPLIGRVANLVRKVCRSQRNSPSVISQANDLKLALEAWDPPDFIERPEDPSTDVQHTLQTAEAYRWATLLHLHQSVPEIPSMSCAELAERVLQYLATVPLASRTIIVQIYPLMVAGCEAATAEDRQWVRDRWAAMNLRMRIGVIDKSATVTEEVWRRRDVYEAQPSTKRKLVATSELHPERQRGVPLSRTDGGFQDADPGRTGMVFSYVEADVETKPDPEGRWPPKPVLKNRMIGPMDAAYTVRGHLHWVGVMWDWGWEGKFAFNATPQL